MLDADLAELYGVETRALLQAVSRNQKRFPEDFMFQMSKEEYELLRSQIVISKKGRGGRRYLPYVFTEQGVAMLSSVLRSNQAVQVNVAIMRAFVRLREALALHTELARKLDELERKIEDHDSAIQSLFEALRQLMDPAVPQPTPEIGFHVKEDVVPYRTKKNPPRSDDPSDPSNQAAVPIKASRGDALVRRAGNPACRRQNHRHPPPRRLLPPNPYRMSAPPANLTKCQRVE